MAISPFFLGKLWFFDLFSYKIVEFPTFSRDFPRFPVEFPTFSPGFPGESPRFHRGPVARAARWRPSSWTRIAVRGRSGGASGPRGSKAGDVGLVMMVVVY